MKLFAQLCFSIISPTYNPDVHFAELYLPPDKPYAYPMCNAVTSTIRYLSPHGSILQHLLPIRIVLDIARNIGRARTSLLVRADLSSSTALGDALIR